MGFIVGMIIGEITQVLLTQVIFPDVTSAITSAFTVEGAWNETQEDTIAFVKIAIDIVFGLFGALSSVVFLNTMNH